MKFLISLFLFFLVITFFGAHYLLYLAITKFFLINQILLKKIILLVIFSLPILFIIFIFLIQGNNIPALSSFYSVTSLWLGVFVNLILASILIFIFLKLGALFDLKLNSSIIATIFFAGALLFSLYGFINATNPRIKNINLYLPNLPTEWEGKKIVQLSDLHIGANSREKFMEKVIKLTNEVEPKIVLISGDMFDGENVDSVLINGWLKEIKSEKGIFFVTGNHENYLATDYKKMLSNSGVKVLQDELVNIEGINLLGLNYPKQGSQENIVEVIKGIYSPQENNGPSILLYHAPEKIKEVSQLGINLQLSGHTHAGQIFPFGFITKIIYQEFNYGLHQLGDYQLYVTSGAGTWGPLMRTEKHSEIPVFTLLTNSHF